MSFLNITFALPFNIGLSSDANRKLTKPKFMPKLSRQQIALKTDDFLLQEISEGNTDAFSVLYDRHSPQLYGLALKILQNRTLADDVIQDVFVNIWKKAGSFNRDRGAPIAWMLILCRNRCIDVLRKTNKSKSRLTELTQEATQRIAENSGISPLESADLSEMSQAARSALNDLPAEQRDPIELAYFKGLSQTEIASELNLPLGTVKTRIRLGMQKLRDVMMQKWENP